MRSVWRTIGLIGICGAVLPASLWARTSNRDSLPDRWYPPHENILYMDYGGLWQQDQYLSPLPYTGQRVGVGNAWWQGFRKASNADTLSHSVAGLWRNTGHVHAQFGWAYSAAHTNSLYALALSGGWGAHYVWAFRRAGVELFAGPYLTFDWMGRLHGSNVNKPYSMDLALDLCAMAGVAWAFRGKHTSYRLRYAVQTNLIGADFLPDYWQSYYELSEGVSGNVRCSGMWNHRLLRHQLTWDMQFLRSTWRLGVAHEYLEYGEPQMMFSREQVSAIVGCVWQYRIQPAHRLSEWTF